VDKIVLRKNMARKRLITLSILVLLGCVICRNGLCGDAISDLKEQLPNMNKYQLQEKLNQIEVLVATDPESIVYNGARYLIKNQILLHDRLVSQIRGLIQSNDIEGSVNSDGTVFIEGTLTGTTKKMSLSADEFSTIRLKELIDYGVNKIKEIN